MYKLSYNAIFYTHFNILWKLSLLKRFWLLWINPLIEKYLPGPSNHMYLTTLALLPNLSNKIWNFFWCFLFPVSCSSNLPHILRWTTRGGVVRGKMSNKSTCQGISRRHDIVTILHDVIMLLKEMLDDVAAKFVHIMINMSICLTKKCSATQPAV